MRISNLLTEGLDRPLGLEEHLPRIREIRPNFFAKTEQVIHDHPAVKSRLLEVRARIFRDRDRR